MKERLAFQVLSNVRLNRREEGIMTDRKKSKGVLVKVNNLGDNELDAALDRALDFLFGDTEDEPIKPAKTKVVKPSSPRQKTSKVSGKKSKGG